MPVYLNQTGDVSGTADDDTFEYTTIPWGSSVVGGLEGRDRLVFDAPGSGLRFSATWESDDSRFTQFHGQVNWLDLDSLEELFSVIFTQIEDLEFTGTGGDDFFSLTLTPGIGSETVIYDAVAGHDRLDFDFSALDADFDFEVVDGTIRSSFGQFAGFEQFYLRGSDRDNVIVTGSANDRVASGAGVDSVSTGEGNDQIETRATGTFDGGSGEDSWDADYSASISDLVIDIGATIAISNGTTATGVEDITLTSGAGDDTFSIASNSRDGRTELDGGAGHDALNVAASPGSLHWSVNSDGLVLSGRGSNGFRFAGFEQVSLTGTTDDDEFYLSGDFRPGQIALDGGEGYDTLTINWSGSEQSQRFEIGPDGLIDSNWGATASSFEHFVLFGGSQADRFIYDSGDDSLHGLAGNDHLAAGDGNDQLDGGDGDDALVGGGGDDVLIERTGNDWLDGGGGVDTLHYTGSGAVTVRLDRVAAQDTGGGGIDTLISIENLGGSAFDDRLIGSASDNRLYGGSGSDVLDGLEGSDTMSGGAGDDRYFVDDEGDVVIDTGGIDKVNARIDYVLGANLEQLTLLGGARAGTGNGLANTVFGSSGGDTLSGLAGDDILRGNDGRDALLGGDGADLLDGGAGKDTLTGGAGRDVFQFRDGHMGATRSLADVIADFSQADGERIGLNLVDADATADGNQAFAWLGSGAFTGVAGELRYAHQAGNTYVEGDTDGDGTADFAIALTGVHALVAQDFLL